MFILRTIAKIIGQILLQAALDAASKKALAEAVRIAEESGLKGGDKMQIAIDYLKMQGTESLKNTTISRLRTLIEQTIDKIGV